ncbi:hypothetical protein D805_0419 [Bifidobacterium thermophilum RBL67]|uniref:Uncharacterized protein n=1 Tax=Bifidobacterium thermophilum RBL67 TaxID=1254439 RepID=M4RB42_9BIFI|nr:hypothetical protein [Bifidobacterium thermacidophilum]AGH40686.1 hypothetical protein D805_0419 [Bifidobacterium thermophilum RBL67]
MADIRLRVPHQRITPHHIKLRSTMVPSIREIDRPTVPILVFRELDFMDFMRSVRA